MTPSYQPINTETDSEHWEPRSNDWPRRASGDAPAATATTAAPAVSLRQG